MATTSVLLVPRSAASVAAKHARLAVAPIGVAAGVTPQHVADAERAGRAVHPQGREASSFRAVAIAKPHRLGKIQNGKVGGLMHPGEVVTTDGVTVQMTHAKWVAIKARISELEAGIREMHAVIPGGTICDPQEVADDLRAIAAKLGVEIKAER